MSAKYLRGMAGLAALVFALVVCLRPSIRAQEKAAASQMRTNWVGGLVIGKKEAGDPIAGRALFPQADSEIEIGLRSDGVVVWRKARP
jgi:hypothetical protein